MSGESRINRAGMSRGIKFPAAPISPKPKASVKGRIPRSPKKTAK